jgi:hypothetical protein
MSGIWRGSFVSADKKVMDLFNIDDRYKYEVQIDQTGKQFAGVTYSYKSTVFYGKASANGTINPQTGKVMLNELKLLELKMSPDSYACWMVCFLQYTKNGDEEFLEGKYSSYRESDSSFCDRGTVFLKRVSTSDFYKEPFLVNKEAEKKKNLVAKATPKTNPPVKTPSKTAIAKNEPPKTRVPVKPATKPPVKPTTTPNKKITPPGKTSTAKTTKPAKPMKPAELKPTPLITTTEPDKTAIPFKPKEPVIIPLVLKNRENEVVQTLVVNSPDITIDIYDNGTIDHDTISVFLDKKNIVNHQMLKATPITVKIKMDELSDYHELVMVADNLGDIPPNTSLMVVKAGDKRYEVRITSTEQKNAVVIFRYEKPR